MFFSKQHFLAQHNFSNLKIDDIEVNMFVTKVMTFSIEKWKNDSKEDDGKKVDVNFKKKISFLMLSSAYQQSN